MTDEINRAIRAAARGEPPERSTRVDPEPSDSNADESPRGDGGSGAEPRAEGADAIHATIRSAGRRPPAAPEGQPPAVPEQPPTPDEKLRALIAAEAGLTIDMGKRLRGETIEELQADAKWLAAEVKRYQAARGPGLGGGVRGGQTFHGPPSVTAQIRAQVEAKRQGIDWLARQFDDERRLPGES
jgi:hypothetical protein